MGSIVKFAFDPVNQKPSDSPSAARDATEESDAQHRNIVHPCISRSAN